ncbi:MAG: Gfo/Idh/MocA family oxidoreductase [Proteobacteria bacterium]|nr:Gfo/Idh/MocA family oxidoreductase [Pseudomonadota bacterium]
MASPIPSSQPAPLKLALIGAGAMGANYVKAVQTLTDVKIAAVVDKDVQRANQVGAVISARAAASLAYAGEIDAALVVVPSADHRAVAEPLLARGIPCLVEKPFALNEEDCRALMTAAEKSGVVLQVGHVERFNAGIQAFLALKPAPADMRTLTARRMNSGSARVTDIDVVLDLMVHDLDVVMALKGLPVTDIRAMGTKDHAVATLTFSDGATAHLTASRIIEGRTRDLTVEMKDGAVYSVDFIQRGLTRDGASLPVAGDANNLGRQMMSFAHAIRHRAPPAVSGAEALSVMHVVWRVQKALGLA